MDGWGFFGLLIGFAALAALILGPIAFFRSFNLPGRVDELERRNLAVVQFAAEMRQRLAMLEARAAPLPDAAPAAQAQAAPVPVPREPVAVKAPEPDTLAFVASEPVTTSPSAISVPAAPIMAEPVQSAVPPISAPVATTPPVRSLEERLGARWTVWVGGVALALGSVLLVRYSIEMGLIGPGVRIIFGLMLAAFLMAAGEFLRQRDSTGASGRTGDIPAVLTAAGTIAAFGAVFAAHALYGFIGPAIAFVVLGGIGIACMALAAVHGPALAGLGLVGALAVPLLVESQQPDPWAVVIYVAIVIAAAYGLARLRAWLWLAIAAAAGAFVWGLAFALGFESLNTALFPAGITHASLHIGLAALVFALARQGAPANEPQRLGLLASVMPSLLAVPAILLLAGGLWRHFDLAWVIWAAVPVAILTACGRAFPAATGALAAAGLFVCAVMVIWPGAEGTAFEAGFFVVREQGRFIAFSSLAAAGVALVSASGLLARQPVQGGISLLQAGAATVTPLAGLALAWLRLRHGFDAGIFAVLAGGLGVAFVAAANVLKSRVGAAAHLGLGVFAAAAIAALSLALVFELDRGLLTVALALAAAGTALVAARLNIPALRWCVAGLGLVVAARFAWEPRIVGADLGTVPVFNWLLYGYGVPALSFALAAFWLRRSASGGGEDVALRLSQSLAILFAALLVFFEIRHGLNHGDPFARSSSLVEQGLMAVSALGFAIVTTRLDVARFGAVFRWASLGFGIIAFASTLIGLGFVQNPFFTDEPVEGGRFLNAILLSYAVPGLLALLLSRLSREVRPGWYGLGAALVALAMLFAAASLEVRRGFMEARIGIERGFDDTEFYTYSAVWLIMGAVLLAYGIWRNLPEARYVSGLFVVGSVVKVFLFDLAGLGGILRALSFIGLGFVLIGIGYVYQRLVFRRAE